MLTLLFCRVHEYNTSVLLLTFLPYHATPIFRNLLSILPLQLLPQFKFLGPYITTLTNPPRHAIAYGAINNDALFAAFNTYALQVCLAGSQHQTLLSFWASITAEAIAGRLDMARSGRKVIERQRQEDVLLRVLPLLKDGLSMHQSLEMVVACFTFTVILASKSQLADKLLDGLMDAVAGALQTEIADAGLICLSILTQQKSDQSVTKIVVTKLAKVADLEVRLRLLSQTYEIENFTLAVIQSTAVNIRAKKQDWQLGLLERLFFTEIVQPARLVVAIGSLLTLLERSGKDAASVSLKDSISDVLRRLGDSDRFSPIMADAVRASGVNLSAVEGSLQIVIDQPEQVPADIDEMEVDSEAPDKAQSPLSRALAHVPQRTVEEHSFLSHTPSHLFKPVLDAFILASQTREGLQSFQDLPLWRSSTSVEQPLFHTFFVRVFCGPHPLQIRHAALTLLGTWLSDHTDFDSQAILPYILLQLADPTQKIRKAAADVLLDTDREIAARSVDSETTNDSPLKQLYRSKGADQPLVSQSAKDVSKAIQRAVLPVIEECVLDPTQIKRALETALVPRSNKSQSNGKTESTELKKHVRLSLFNMLMAHIISTPVYSVKIGLLSLLTNIEKVGVTRKQKELMPLLLDWASLTAEAAGRLVSAERVDISHVSSTLCSIVSPSESDAVQTLLDLTSSSVLKRQDLVVAVSERIRYFWPQLKSDKQVAATDSLLNLISHDRPKPLDRLQIGRLVFESVDVSTDVLIHLLDSVHSLIHAVSEHSPTSKRRRNNESQAVAADKSPSKAVFTNLRKVIFVLELVDNSSTEGRPQLLSSLFHVFDALHQLKLRQNSDLSYLLSLSLGTLLSIVRDTASPTSKLDLSTIRLDVVIDCMRTTASSQVQNTALLFVAAVASIAPERVVDTIMPVFTFMGTDMLGKEDEYSSYIVDQTMEKVIPPLIRSLYSRGKDVIAETSDLISSFTVAYEHILPSRRLRLFKKLVSNLGDETFLWVVVSNLTNRYADQADVMSFIISMINSFEIDVQVKTCTSLVVLVQDTVAVEPERPTHLENFKSVDAETPPELLQPLLRTIDNILTESNMKSRIVSLEASDTLETHSLLVLWEDLLGRVIHLVQTPELDAELLANSKTALSSLLNLMPIITFIDITEHFVQAGPEIVSRTVLRLLESRLRTQRERSLLVQTKAITLLQTLFQLLSQSEDQISKHAAIACIDRICETYGRKDIPVVLQAARIISGDSCLNSPDNKLNTLTLLCLSSIIEIVKEAVVPVIPQMVPKVFRLLHSSVEAGSDQVELHNAAFTLLSALLAHVPFMISEEYLDRILVLSAESRAEFQDSDQTHVIRGQALLLIGKNIDLANVVGSLQRTWATAIENDIPAVQQALSMLSNSVKAAAKSRVIKKADQISAFLLQAFDLRRIQFTNRSEDSYTDTDVAEIEQTINSIAIEIIYKLNDTTFRPIFLHLIDWATKCQGVKSFNLSKAQTLRKTTLFNFLAHFFRTLKSIVTSYGTHIVEPTIAVLTEISTTIRKSPTPARQLSKSKPKSPRKPPNPLSSSANQNLDSDPETLPLYLSTLSALHSTLHHDHDAHFSTPTLFTPLATTLIAQLHLASHPTFAPHISTAIIPTIVQLATAVVDTPEHLKTLNTLICGLRREEDVLVRRASVEVQLALAGAGAELGGRDGGVGRGGEDVDDGGEEEEGARIAEEWCGTVLSIGEGMVYVNELLEDEDEVVERRVRKLVRRVRLVLGEEGIFE